MKEITLKQDQQRKLFNILLEKAEGLKDVRSLKETVVVNPLPVEKLSSLTGLKEQQIYEIIKTL